ncbi:MAG TPA: hypothetical protein DCZ03_10300 [Gammaproteobacteria bacterium]|nr:hypothetical protein [Gammaproteobacteria bacterium]
MPKPSLFALRRFIRRAEKIIKNQAETQSLLDEAQEKVKQNKTKLNKMIDELKAMIRMIQAWRRGEYREIPIRTVVILVAAILYFVTPLDFIPDFIPLTGFLDDATIIALVFSSLRDQIQAFIKWESSGRIFEHEPLETEEELEEKIQS